MAGNASLNGIWHGFRNAESLWPAIEWEEVMHFNWHILKNQISNANPPKVLPENLVLGKKIEWCFAQALEQSEQYALLAHGLQIFDEQNRTLGEIDFLIQEQVNRSVVHLEFVCKFYLADGDPQLISSWVGPNKKDKLLYKLDKLRQFQFPIINKRETKNALQRLAIDVSKLNQQVCFLGQLYLPYGTKASRTILNNQAVEGYWYTQKQFAECFGDEEMFYLPEKQEWLNLPGPKVDWLPRVKLDEPVNEQLINKRSPMLWHKSADGDFHRLFVVWW